MTAITMLVLFVAVQLVTGLGALLFSNLDKLGTGYPIDQLTVSPMATGISMLVGEGLLALGLWLWFFRFEKGVRAKSIERPELLGIFNFTSSSVMWCPSSRLGGKCCRPFWAC